MPKQQLQLSVAVTKAEKTEIDRIAKATGETKSNIIRMNYLRPISTTGQYRDPRAIESRLKLPDFSSKE